MNLRELARLRALAKTPSVPTATADEFFVRPYRLDDDAGFSCVCVALPGHDLPNAADLSTNDASLARILVAPAAPGIFNLLVVSRDFEGTPVATLIRIPCALHRCVGTVRRLCAAMDAERRYDIELLAGLPTDDDVRLSTPEGFLLYRNDSGTLGLSTSSIFVRHSLARALAWSQGTTKVTCAIESAAVAILADPLLAEEVNVALGAGFEVRRLLAGLVNPTLDTCFRALSGPFGRGSRWLDLYRTYPLLQSVLIELLESNNTPAIDGRLDSEVLSMVLKQSIDADLRLYSSGCPSLRQVSAGQSIRTAAALLDALRDIPEFRPSALTKHTGHLIPSPASILYKGLCAVPEDWRPKTHFEWLCALAVLSVAWALQRQLGIPLRQSLSHVGGRWQAQCRILGRLVVRARALGDGISLLFWDPPRSGRGGATPNDLIGSAADMVNAFAAAVLTPALTLVLLRPRQRDAVKHASARMLFSDKGAAGILRLAERWHHHQGEIDRKIRAISNDTTAARWKSGLPTIRFDHNGETITIVPLTSEDEMIDEGAKSYDPSGMKGLAHCVGGTSYVVGCLEGSHRIVSLRSVDDAGRPARLSTAQIVINHEGGRIQFHVAQHHGYGNSLPSLHAEFALLRYVSLLNRDDPEASGVVPAELAPDPNAATTHNQRYWSYCGYDASNPANIEKALRIWEPMLPRPLRGLSRFGVMTPARAASLPMRSSDAT